jgi:hypothetical protein
MDFNQRESRREIVDHLKARAKDGGERTIEEVKAFARVRGPDGNWGDWQEMPNHQFFCNGIFCNRISPTEFVPLMTEELLTLVTDTPQ